MKCRLGFYYFSFLSSLSRPYSISKQVLGALNLIDRTFSNYFHDGDLELNVKRYLIPFEIIATRDWTYRIKTNSTNKSRIDIPSTVWKPNHTYIPTTQSPINPACLRSIPVTTVTQTNTHAGTNIDANPDAPFQTSVYYWHPRATDPGRFPARFAMRFQFEMRSSRLHPCRAHVSRFRASANVRFVFSTDVHRAMRFCIIVLAIARNIGRVGGVCRVVVAHRYSNRRNEIRATRYLYPISIALCVPMNAMACLLSVAKGCVVLVSVLCICVHIGWYRNGNGRSQWCSALNTPCTNTQHNHLDACSSAWMYPHINAYKPYDGRHTCTRKIRPLSCRAL